MFTKGLLVKRVFDPKFKNLVNLVVNPFSKSFLARCLHVDVYETPNPNSIKFSIDRNILKDNTQPTTFSNLQSSENCDIAKQLHHMEGIETVFIGKDFITVSKQVDEDWQSLVDDIKNVISTYFTHNTHVDIAGDIVSESKGEEEEEDETVMTIKQLIEEKIRPTIQADGGDVLFMGFEGGVVKVKLQGACTSCPSSQVTLKRGVQNMLQFYVPEVMGVIQVTDDKDDLSSNEFDAFDNSLNKS